jgi:PBP1b-binding outer membrane lipoprotein LpoB
MVHSLIKDFIMRKLVLVAAATAGILALSACSKEEAAPAATETAAEATDVATDVATDAATEAAAEATTEAAKM